MTSERTVRVVVAEDHPLYRRALVDAIDASADLETVGEAGDGDEALTMIADRRPDVLVLDLRMDGMPSEQIVAELSHTLPIIVLSAETDPMTVSALLDAGAAGYIAKRESAEGICSAIRRVADGQAVIGHELQKGIVAALRVSRAREREVLTARELECLGFLAEGRSSPEIAELLMLGPSTVKTHLRTLYQKLGVSDRGAAVAEGMRRGLVR